MGSFVKDYLIDELRIPNSRLVPLSSPEEIDKAFQHGPNNGGIAAFVDERAYMELFLSTRCHRMIVGREITSNGWAFAFHKDSPLAADMSTAIVKLTAETDGFESLNATWLTDPACSNTGEVQLHADRLKLHSFLGLFIVCAITCLLALVIFFAQTVWQFWRSNPEASSGLLV
uniref:Uncharacterized protein n=1 Tax=Kalanchoe fedtschenkoi TaxID=63787 RepID=A0A7N0T7U3_KALFE